VYLICAINDDDYDEKNSSICGFAYPGIIIIIIISPLLKS